MDVSRSFSLHSLTKDTQTTHLFPSRITAELAPRRCKEEEETGGKGDEVGSAVGGAIGEVEGEIEGEAVGGAMGEVEGEVEGEVVGEEVGRGMSSLRRRR